MNARRCAETTKKHVAVILAAAVTLTGCGQPREDEALRAQAAIQADCDGWNTRGFFENATDAVVQHCLDMGADVNARTGEEVTPLHLASQFGTPGQIKVLVDVGADIHALAYSDRRDSGWESGGGRYEFRSHWPPLLVAAVSGTPANVKALIDAGANVGRDELVWTVARGTPANLKALVHADVDIEGRDERGRTALHEAAGEWDSEAHRGHIEVLLEAGADIEARDRDGWTPLHLAAAWDGDIDRVEALVGAGANIEARGQGGWTALHLAASMPYDGLSSGSPRALEALLKLGANTEVRDDEGQTPLHVAALHPEAEYGLPESQTKLGVLLAAGADIEARNRRGRTPLHVAAGIAYADWMSDYLSILLKAGASVAARDEDGRTPLHIAAGVADDMPRHPDNVTKLLNAGADLETLGRNRFPEPGGSQGEQNRAGADFGPSASDGAVTTSTGWRIVVAYGIGTATKGGRTVELFADEEEIREVDAEPQGSWHRILSAVGSVVSIERSYYYDGGAHPSYGAIWETIDLETGESSSLTAIFPEGEIFAALRADHIVREAYRRAEEPDSLFELIDNLDGDCAMWFSREMLTGFAFHHVRENQVAVRIGLPHGCEVARGSFTQLGVYLDIPTALSEALGRAKVDGTLMDTLGSR